MQGGQQTIVADLDVERENQFVTIMNVPVSPHASYTANLSIQRGGLAWGMWTLLYSTPFILWSVLPIRLCTVKPG